MNAEIERGRGGKSVFSPNKDLGTRVGDEQGTGKYFPYEKLFDHYRICLFELQNDKFSQLQKRASRDLKVCY